MRKREFLKACTSVAGLSLAGCATGGLGGDDDSGSQGAGQDKIWKDLFARMPQPLASLASNGQHEVQIVYTPIRRVGGVVQTPQTYTWHLAPQRWFAGSSLAKLPIALLAAEQFSTYQLGFETAIELEGPPVSGEWPSKEPGAESFQRGLRRMFAVSDNAPFNRIYDFLGPDAMNARLAAMGYPNARLIARLGGAEGGDERTTRAGSLVRRDGEILQRFPRRQASVASFPFGRALAGKAWQNDDGTLVPGPHDFSSRDFLPLRDAHDMLMALMLPEQVQPKQRWAITADARRALLDAMQMLPRESTGPIYPEKQFPDSFATYFVIGGSSERKPESLTLIGKGSLSYGYMADVRYLRDSVAGGEALLSAVIYANADGVLNDGKYEYETVALPFMVNLGKAALAHSKSLG